MVVDHTLCHLVPNSSSHHCERHELGISNKQVRTAILSNLLLTTLVYKILQLPLFTADGKVIYMISFCLVKEFKAKELVRGFY